ncbi:MAG: PilZ domain-containing protein [Spongiibacteraceae bacterium]|jgi:hypothetical protein|nr:PilZ domain-containing protein [Spongiibacteraceae bacterium]
MDKSDTPDERRRFTRVDFDETLVIRQDGDEWRARLLDISLKGLLVEPLDDWRLDTSKGALATLRLDDEHSIEMRVQWRHGDQHLAGFECTSIDIDSITHLRRLVALNLGDDELVGRELGALGSA